MESDSPEPHTEAVPPVPRRRSTLPVLLASLALIALAAYGYWRFVYYPTTPQYALDQFLQAARNKDYNRLYDMVQVPLQLRAFVHNGDELRGYAQRFPGMVPDVQDYRFDHVTVNGDKATIDTTTTTGQGDRSTTVTIPFQLVRTNSIWRIDGNWILSEAVRRGVGGFLLNNSSP